MPESISLPPLCAAFGHFIARQERQSMDDVIPRTAAWLSWYDLQGHTCLDLAEKSGQRWFDGVVSSMQTHTPRLEEWREQLLHSTCIGSPGCIAPMVLDGDRLYLHRYHHHECRLADALLRRVRHTTDGDDEARQRILNRFFPDDRFVEQKRAVALAAHRLFSVISGGPGTGKTTSVLALLQLLHEQQAGLRIVLAAPTGKAAARMMDSIRQQGTRLINTDHIPEYATTLHRLLGYDGRTFRHHRDYPLTLDVLIIDEASMIDSSLMAAVVDALPEQARLILLGDRDQLASVEAGNVLGDITGHGIPIHYSAATRDFLARMSVPLGDEAPAPCSTGVMPHMADAIALLKTSHRFAASSGIAQLARSCNQGDARAALNCFEVADDIQLHPGDATLAAEHAIAAYRQLYQQHRDPAALLNALQAFQLLCAVRQGLFGIESLNRRIANALQQSGLLYGRHGELLIITRNHPAQQVFNGDVGIIWQDQNGVERLHLRTGDGELKTFPPALFPDCEPAWAITVHKAQGSEFDTVSLLLSDDANHPLHTRELVYTAITRACHRFQLYAHPAVLSAAIGRNIQRSSGLAQRLGW